MDEFCGSKFWDLKISWDTDNPDFTLCFEETILVWIPCAFLWITLPFEIFNLNKIKNYNTKLNSFSLCKLILIAVLATLTLTNFVHHIFFDTSKFPVHVYSPLIKLATFVLFFCLTYINRRSGIRSSAILFLFSFFLVICGAPQFRTEIKLNSESKKRENSEFVSYMIYYPTTLLLFFLNCFADTHSSIREHSYSKNDCPEKRASFLSRLFFFWFDPFAWKGYKKSLEDNDLWNLDESNTSAGIAPIFEKYWSVELKKTQRHTDDKPERNGNISKTKSASIFLPLCKTFIFTFLKGTVLKIFQDVATFLSPQILSLLILYTQSNEPTWRGFLYAFLLFIIAILQTLLSAQYFHQMYKVGIRIRTCLISAIYKKALRISNGARKDFSSGEIVNLMSVDAQKFTELMAYINLLWSAPLQIIIAMFFLWQILGPSALAGLAVMIILVPLNGYVGAKMRTLQIKQMEYKDDRVKLMNEILSGIKVLKLYAWETSFEKEVLCIRSKELKVLKKQAYLNAAFSLLWTCSPFLVSLIAFAVFVLSSDENILDAKTAFVSLSLFNILRFPLSMLPMIILLVVQANVSSKRINKFLNSEELKDDNVTHSENAPLLAIDKGTFSWEGPNGIPVLHDINMKVNPGSLIAIVGSVGAGKSSLISAFLGETYKISGNVNTKGTIAYVPQQAWIQNSTLKDNITFGNEKSTTYYQKVIDACALKSDLEILPAGDLTEIGEKGVNLSGGQKQRISLARAVYFGADIYFLDDPLSAVDSHVGKHIFENVVGHTGLLKNKTRILVTHSVTYLSQVDFIIVLKNGSIAESGTYEELLNKKGDFADFLLTYMKNEETEITEKSNEEPLNNEMKFSRSMSKISESHSVGSFNRQKSNVENEKIKKKSNNDLTGQKLIEEEKMETGNIKLEVYIYYFASVGLFMMTITVAMSILLQCSSITSDLWLSKWSSDTSAVVDGLQVENIRNLYLSVYAILGLSKGIAGFFAEISLKTGCWRSSKKLHSFMLYNIFRLPLAFMDVTPIGRLLSRFSKDIDIVDNVLPGQIGYTVFSLGNVAATLFIISYSTPIFITVILPVGILYYFVQRFYTATSRQLKRLESVSRSPIFSHFGESVAGASSIRAYGLQQQFINLSEEKVDFNQRSYFLSIVSNRWLSIRLEMIGNVIIFLTSLFAALQKESLSPGLVGLSVSYALQITETLNWLVRITSDVESNIVAVERIKEYGEVPQEAAWEVENQNISAEWPEKGCISFIDYKVRYREGLDLVLKGISFTINGGEKVGIVGRTGAGKSSLTLSLFRIIEAAGGKIIIDGIDISKLGLQTLRSRLTIIPQDPVLFSGSLRINLDPASEYSDENIWYALELAHLKSYITSLKVGLQYEVNEGGENFSVGQRQLICLARALLRKTKVLVLDEATAAIDLETDDLIQTTIRNEFKDCTVLSIAHRLNTIMDYDKVIVLDKGCIIEYDSPTSLLRKTDSVFYGMSYDAGLV